MNVLRSERFAAALLLVAAVLGLAIANLPFGPPFVDVKDAHLDMPWLGLDLSAGHWISDGLLAIFFFIVAVELKRELVIGELNSLSKAMLPAIAARGRRDRAGRDLPRVHRRHPDRRRLADPDGDRHRLRAGRARRVRPVPADPRAHLPARARGARRPHRDPHHRLLLHERRRPRRARLRHHRDRAVRRRQPAHEASVELDPVAPAAVADHAAARGARRARVVLRLPIGRARDDRRRGPRARDGPAPGRAGRPRARAVVERRHPAVVRLHRGDGARAAGVAERARPGVLGHPRRPAGRQDRRHHDRRRARRAGRTTEDRHARSPSATSSSSARSAASGSRCRCS